MPTDLILLDLKMPVVDGRETLRLLRDAGDETPVVVITAYGSVPDAVAAMKLGAVDFLPKPVSPVTLRAVVAGDCALGSADRVAVKTPVAAAAPAHLFEEDLGRTRRAMERREYDDAEFFLRIADALRPDSQEVARLRETLHSRKLHPEGFSGLGEWFGVVASGDLDRGLRLVVHQGGDVRSVGRPPAIAFS